jgi:hypothetical protein
MPHRVATLAVEDDHQQDGDFIFDASHVQDGFDLNLEVAPHVQDDSDLNLEVADHQNELQEMISKPQWNLNFFSNYFNDHIDSLG